MRRFFIPLGNSFGNFAIAKEVTHKSSVIARSEATKQSVLAVWEIATGLRPRNDSRSMCPANDFDSFCHVTGVIIGLNCSMHLTANRSGTNV